MAEEHRNDPPRDLLVFQVSREITNLSKNFLTLLEDMRDFESLLSDKNFLAKRKKVLDSSNDSIRRMVGLLDHFTILLKNNNDPL